MCGPTAAIAAATGEFGQGCQHARRQDGCRHNHSGEFFLNYQKQSHREIADWQHQAKRFAEALPMHQGQNATVGCHRLAALQSKQYAQDHLLPFTQARKGSASRPALIRHISENSVLSDRGDPCSYRVTSGRTLTYTGTSRRGDACPQPWMRSDTAPSPEYRTNASHTHSRCGAGQQSPEVNQLLAEAAAPSLVRAAMILNADSKS